MNSNEFVERALASARELQKSMGEAASKSAEQLQPVLEQQLKNAQELQATLSKHAQASSVIAQEQTKVAIGHLQEFIRIGGEAARASAVQAKEYAAQMAEESRKAAASVAEAMGRKPGD